MTAPTNIRLIVYVVAGLATTLMPGVAFASGSPTTYRAQTSADPEDQIISEASNNKGSAWSLGLGVAVIEPGYIGVSRQITPLPLVFYHNGRFFLAGVSVGYVPFSGRYYSFSVLVKPLISRLSASESPELAGMQSRPWSIAGGGRLSLFGGWGQAEISLFTDMLNRSGGTEADVAYRYAIHMEGWTLSPGIGLAWENAPLTNYYYGVSEAEVAPGRPAYSPGRALNPFAQLNLQLPIGGHWHFLGGVKYRHFARSIQNSPIMDRSGTFTLFFAVDYRFVNR
ncbi:MAG: MipA/OmpV family protein [Acidiferrobacter sp.]